jgi:hypothetical protein
MALVTTARAGLTKCCGQFGRKFLHLYWLWDGRRRCKREHYSRLPSYQMHRVPKSLPILSSTLIGAEDNFRGIDGIWNIKLIT